MTRSANELGGRVNRLLTEVLDPALGNYGYFRKGTEYSKSSEFCIQHLFFRFRMKEDPKGKFSYHANLEIPEVEKILCADDPSQQPSFRIGKQMGHLHRPFRHEEWDIGGFFGFSRLGKKVMKHVESFGLPFLDEFSSPRRIAEAIAEGEYFNLDVRDARFVLASILRFLGEERRSEAVLDECVTQLSGTSFEWRYKKISEYLNEQPVGTWIETEP